MRPWIDGGTLYRLHRTSRLVGCDANGPADLRQDPGGAPKTLPSGTRGVVNCNAGLVRVGLRAEGLMVCRDIDSFSGAQLVALYIEVLGEVCVSIITLDVIEAPTSNSPKLSIEQNTISRDGIPSL